MLQCSAWFRSFSALFTAHAGFEPPYPLGTLFCNDNYLTQDLGMSFNDQRVKLLPCCCLNTTWFHAKPQILRKKTGRLLLMTATVNACMDESQLILYIARPRSIQLVNQEVLQLACVSQQPPESKHLEPYKYEWQNKQRIILLKSTLTSFTS